MSRSSTSVRKHMIRRLNRRGGKKINCKHSNFFSVFLKINLSPRNHNFFTYFFMVAQTVMTQCHILEIFWKPKCEAKWITELVASFICKDFCLHSVVENIVNDLNHTPLKKQNQLFFYKKEKKIRSTYSIEYLEDAESQQITIIIQIQSGPTYQLNWNKSILSQTY